MSGEERELFTARISPLRDRLLNFLRTVPEFVINSREDGAPHIVHFSYPGMKGEVLARKLEELGMVVSTRSACSSRLSEPSRVLLSMGKDVSTASGGIRISFGDSHTEADVILLEQALISAVQALKNPIASAASNFHTLRDVQFQLLRYGVLSTGTVGQRL